MCRIIFAFVHNLLHTLIMDDKMSKDKSESRFLAHNKCSCEVVLIRLFGQKEGLVSMKGVMP